MLAVLAGVQGGAAADATTGPTTTEAPLVVAADPCGPSPAPGVCGTDPAKLSATWPAGAIVGGVVVAWQGAGRPAGAPSPATAAAGLSTAAGTCVQAPDGSSQSCTWGWPAVIDGAGGQQLNGTYSVTACTNDPGASPQQSVPTSQPPGTSAPTSSPPTSTAPSTTPTTAPTTSTTRGTTTTTQPFPLSPPGVSAADSGQAAASPSTSSETSTAALPASSSTTAPAGPSCHDAGLAPANVAVGAPPAAPSGFTAASGSPNVLRWAAGAEDDLAGYEVARDGATIWACSEHGSAVAATACPGQLALDDPAPAGQHTWSVTALRLPAQAGAPLLVSVPATTKASSSGAAGVGLPSVPGFVAPRPGATTPRGGPHPSASGSRKVAAPTTTDPGYSDALPYADGAGSVPGVVASAEREDGGAHTAVGHAALIGLAALLVAIAAHLMYLNSLVARRQVEAAASTAAADGPPGRG